MHSMRRMDIALSLALALVLAVGCRGEPEPEDARYGESAGGEETREQAMRAEREQPGMHARGGERHARMMEGDREEGEMMPDMHGRRGTTPAGDDMLGAMCPMLTSTTAVEVENVDQGVALSFTAERQAEVEALRGHVRHMASMPGWQRPASPQMPAAMASVVDVPMGARLELRARSPQDVDMLRARTRMRAESLRTGECPMMQAAAPSRARPPG